MIKRLTAVVVMIVVAIPLAFGQMMEKIDTDGRVNNKYQRLSCRTRSNVWLSLNVSISFLSYQI